MPAKVEHLAADEVVAVHQALIDAFDGTAGLRDADLLERALLCPRSSYCAGLAETGTALFESLLMNDPFLDGNKPVAFFATDVFLRLNGWRLQVDADEAHAFLIGLIERDECDYQRLLPWLRAHLTPNRPAVTRASC